MPLVTAQRAEAAPATRFHVCGTQMAASVFPNAFAHPSNAPAASWSRLKGYPRKRLARGSADMRLLPPFNTPAARLLGSKRHSARLT
jgi:hypothetical protein